MSKTSDSNIENINFVDALGERYLAYSLMTIMSRSLPDVRDGLKPVHRRLLYAMMQLKLDPKSAYKKCARVVGDVIGKFHPHGDVAVYETLARLAQDFSLRYPLIDGQGNFGSIDGDNPAAARYTESRLTEIALYLLKDLDKDTVDFSPTYDDQDKEPKVLPACFPNLLANGSEGIAVGMATSIPPHNLDELCEAMIAMIQKPGLDTRAIFDYVQGPDFPTGGVIVESRENIIKAYEVGRGAIRLRAKWYKEQLANGLYQIVITEIPYQIQKAKLIERIAELYKEKKLVLLGNIRDESAQELRVIIEPKTRATDPDMLMESLFKLTDLEIKFNINMNVLDEHLVPSVMSLSDILNHFIKHRRQVIVRRSKYIISQITDRLEIIDGLLIAHLNIDEVIEIIRNDETPKATLIARFNLTENQVESILNIRLRSLAKLEEITLQAEKDKLSKERAVLEKLISDPKQLDKELVSEIRDLQKKFGKDTEIGKRRTDFGEVVASAQVISIEAFVEREPVTIFCSKFGWIRAIKGHNEDYDVKYKEGDEARFQLTAQTTDQLIIVTKQGKFFTISCDKIQKGKGFGEPLNLMVDLDSDDIIEMFIYKPNSELLIATKRGKGFVITHDDLIAQTKLGKQIVNLVSNDYTFLIKQITGEYIAVVGDNRRLLIYKVEEIAKLKKGQGVTLQKYQDATLSDIQIFNLEEGFTWVSQSKKTRTETYIDSWMGKRGQVGKAVPIGFSRSNKFL